MKHLDIIIVGAGAAGMSLLHAIRSQNICTYSVLLIDEKIKQENDKTWCYWGKKPFDIFDKPYHQWQQIGMGLNGEYYRKDLDELRYYCIRSGDFYTKILAEVNDDPCLDFAQEAVIGVCSGEGCATVHAASGKTYTADWVFDSRPQPQLVSVFPENSTWQHFVGIEVTTDRSVFDPSSATLMDFAFGDADSVQFAYVLPFSSTRALVEITAFSQSFIDKDSFEALAHQYIGDALNCSVQEVHYVESGSIPMTSHRFERRPSPRVMRIGTVGGATRASTGYTFANIQRDSAAIVRSLQKYAHPFHGDVQSTRARFYDRLLLDFMQHEPERIPTLFYNMFKKNHPARVLRFLDGDTTFYEECMLFLTMPWEAFLKALFRQLLRPKVQRDSHHFAQPIQSTL